MTQFNDQQVNKKTVLLFILAAYFFSVAIRYIWVFQMQGNPDFLWNGELMINTNDGFYFASGAQSFLEGTLSHNPRVPDLFFTATVTLAAFAAKLLPVSLDTVVLYMPAFISSLVVIPIILIGRLLGSTYTGFLAALVGSIGWSYYNRTMIGYFDTDMFSAMAPMFILYFLMASIKKEEYKYALLASLSFLIYPYLYDQGRAVVYAMGLMYMGYMIVFHRKDDFTYHSIFLISLGLLNLHWAAQLVAIVAAYLLMQRKIIKAEHSKYISVVTVLAFLYFGDVFSLIMKKVLWYAERGVESEGLKFVQVSQTVREAGTIPFDVMANRISGSVIGVLTALVGYAALVFRHRVAILALPLIGIGLFSLFGGLRFTVYAVAIAALSSLFLFHLIGSQIKHRVAGIAVTTLLAAGLIYPNITHIIAYKVPTTFTHSEVQLLDDFKQQSSSKDYVVTWWDYGYPLWYYADKNTLIDGGKHGRDNFLVSQILTTDSQLEAARLSRIAVETYIESDYKIIADTLFKNKQPDQLNVNDYLEELRYGSVELPEATRDIYLYLPYRMLNIFPTVQFFSNLDLNTGVERNKPFFYATQNFKDTQEAIDLGRGVVLLKKEGALRLGQQKVPIKSFYTVTHDQNQNVQTKTIPIQPNAQLSVIFMPCVGLLPAHKV